MTGYLVNINNDCNKCMECVESCQTGVLTEEFINRVKNRLNRTGPPDEIFFGKYANEIVFRKYMPECTYCESCEDICGQSAIWIIDPEWEELQ